MTTHLCCSQCGFTAGKNGWIKGAACTVCTKNDFTQAGIMSTKEPGFFSANDLYTKESHMNCMAPCMKGWLCAVNLKPSLHKGFQKTSCASKDVKIPWGQSNIYKFDPESHYRCGATSNHPSMHYFDCFDDHVLLYRWHQKSCLWSESSISYARRTPIWNKFIGIRETSCCLRWHRPQNQVQGRLHNKHQRCWAFSLMATNGCVAIDESIIIKKAAFGRGKGSGGLQSLFMFTVHIKRTRTSPWFTCVFSTFLMNWLSSWNPCA